MKLISVYPNYCDEGGVAYTCFSLMDQLESVAEREYWGFAFPPKARRTYTRGSLPHSVFALAARLGARPSHFVPHLERTVLRSVSAGDVVWMWPPTRSRFAEKVVAKGARLVVERINTCGRMYHRKVRAAYEALGWPPMDDTDPRTDLEEETRVVGMADAIFAPNRFVRESLEEIGCPPDRIIDTSYGWSPGRMAGKAANLPRDGRLRFLFVGTGSVRKGLPQLLMAWKEADIDADLILAGDIEANVNDRCADLLRLPSVTKLGYVQDIAGVYHSCDVFVFPTHEEGGPQVTFEAAGCGLALLVSPMGTGGAFRADEDALVVDPLSHEALVSGLRRYAMDESLRNEMQARARQRAQLYTWELVAQRRLQALERHFGKF